MSACCNYCDGAGSISYNPNLNPNSFPGSTIAKCPHCGGTGRDTRMWDAAFAVAGDGAKPWLRCLTCGRLQLVLDPIDRADMADNPPQCSCGGAVEWTAQPCSWCLAEQYNIGAPAGTSHGICERHAAAELARARQTLEARR